MINLLSTRNIVIAVIVAIILGLALSTSYTVTDQERGVVLTNGKVTSVAEPGLHFKWPVFQSVVFISTMNRSLVFAKLAAYSKDKQTADLKVSVSYHIPPTEVGKLYQQYSSIQGIENVLVSRNVPTDLENAMGQYTAEKIIQSRVELGLDYASRIRKSVTGPITIDSVQIENVDFDDSYEESIREQMKKGVQIATQANETLRQIETNKQKVNSAQADADATVATATAEATATRMRGDAEAHAIKVKSDALASSPNLIELTKAERWDGKLPTSMIPNSAVPFVNVK